MSKNSSLQVMQERDMHKVVVGQKIMRVVSQFFLYLFLFAIAFIILFPFYWMVISSVKTLDEYLLTIPTLFPREFDFANYAEAFNTANLGRLFGNTVFVGVVSTILSLVITVLSAFAFARLEFKGKNAMFAALLATMMIPGELFTITNYKTVNDFGWLDLETYGFTVLIVPFLVSVFYIYLLKQNFMQIPNELYLAAKVDGTSDLKYLWKVMIPLALPTLISITILKMMGSWNTYMWPNLVADSQNYWLVTNGLRKFSVTVDNRPDTPVQMAAVAIVSAPLFMVFLFLRKYIMKGVSRSGIKG
ncbi:MAG: carbohydrate ABC transporter permease [Clostridia bacterium]|nr:carbohydrate ABC transporter permease [Clostridia bacterium]